MCGISGIINFDGSPVKQGDLRMMMSSMKHRGPDDEGLFVKDNFGFGFVRLSIIDLTLAGHQPMFSNDGKHMIIFNGEVYNYLEIKKELEKSYVFNSETDTEVVLASYLEWGEDCLEVFNGMFGFAIFDLEKNEIFAARDRFGIKPFYYYQNNKKFIFASEVKSLLTQIEKIEANDDMIFDYLVHNRTDHTCQTFFKGIKKLQHGHILRINNAGVLIKKWYSLSDKLDKSIQLSPAEYKKLFKDSLKLRLRADVPIGVSLSGGIDSSTIVAALAEEFDLKNLNTFSAIFEGHENVDESPFIFEFKEIIENMHFTRPNADSFFRDFEKFIEAHNEPVPDTGPYIQFKVMELASKYVKVTLDGQGADEQLAGYHYFFGSYFLELLRELKWATFINESYNYFRVHKSMDSWKYLLFYMLPNSFQKKFSKQKYPSVNWSFFSNKKKKDEVNNLLLKPKSLRESLLQHFEFKLEHLLRWEDLNSMNFSIESRVPFLDHRLVEATIASSSKTKIQRGQTKVVLREAFKDILPPGILKRTDKKGFSNPRDEWFRSTDMKNRILSIINSERFKNRGYFNYDIALMQLENHMSKKEDNSKEIWKWICLEIWFRKFID